MGGQCHALDTLPPGKRSITHCMGVWVSQVYLDGYGKSWPHWGSNPRPFSL